MNNSNSLNNKKVFFYIIVVLSIIDLILPFGIQIIYKIDTFRYRTIIFIFSLIPFLISIVISLISYLILNKQKNNLVLFIIRILLIIPFFCYFMFVMSFAFFSQSDETLKKFYETYGYIR